MQSLQCDLFSELGAMNGRDQISTGRHRISRPIETATAQSSGRGVDVDRSRRPQTTYVTQARSHKENAPIEQIEYLRVNEQLLDRG